MCLHFSYSFLVLKYLVCNHEYACINAPAASFRPLKWTSINNHSKNYSLVLIIQNYLQVMCKELSFKELAHLPSKLFKTFFKTVSRRAHDIYMKGG